jgi:hypothetical protein
MNARHTLLLASSLLLTASSSRMADCGRKLSRLQGWTIVQTGNIKGAFKGCEHDKLVEMMDGTILRCASYGYQYAYMPDAVVFGKTLTVGDKSVTMIKMMVEDELYDMNSVATKP